MSNKGYDQFFKNAKKNASNNGAKNISIEQLRNSVSRRSKKVKRKFPIAQFIVFLICAVGLFLAVENVDKQSLDKIETALQKIEIGIGLAQAEEVKHDTIAKAEDKKMDEKEKIAAEEKPKESDELDKLYKLTERKKELDLKEEELNKKAKEIDIQKVYVEQKLKELEDYRSKISNMLQDRVKTDATKIENLVQIYSNMRPNQAAKVFETMDEDLVIEILAKMKKKTAADVLNLMKAEKAQLFAERYAGYRMPAALPKQETKTDSANETAPSKDATSTEAQKP